MTYKVSSGTLSLYSLLFTQRSLAQVLTCALQYVTATEGQCLDGCRRSPRVQLQSVDSTTPVHSAAA